MNTPISRILVVAALALLITPALQAQQSYRTFKEWYGWFQTGYLWPQGDYGDATTSDWTVGGGASYVPRNSALSFDFGLDYYENNVKNSILNNLDSDYGKIEVWSATAGLSWSPNPNKDVHFYLKGGLSYNWVDARVSNFEWVPGWICDPWYWWVCGPGWVPGELVNARYSTSDWGYYAGAGVNFRMSGTTSFYIEATYKVIKTDIDTQYIPLVLGFKF